MTIINEKTSYIQIFFFLNEKKKKKVFSGSWETYLIVLGLQAQIKTGKLNTSALRSPQLSLWARPGQSLIQKFQNLELS